MGAFSRLGDRVLGLRLHRVLLANLLAQVAIVFTGGVVRQCVPGSYRPVVNQAQGWHKDVEFGNRLLTYVLVIAALVALIAVGRAASLGLVPRRLRRLGAVPFLGIWVQAIIGGISVLTDLNPWVVSLHFLCSAALIAASTWLLLSAALSTALATGPETGPATVIGEPVPPARAEVRWLALAVAAVAAAVVVLGTAVTGSGPHSGDADVSHRFDFDVRDVAWLHADAVWLFVGLVLALILALGLTDAPAVARRRAVGLMGITLAQGVIGYVQYFTGVPAVLVAFHMLGASLLVVAVTATLHGVLAPVHDPARPALSAR